MALKEVIGQDMAIRILTGCVRKDRVPHALLFAGEEGVGKYLTAMNFAKLLNCQGPGNESAGGPGLFYNDVSEAADSDIKGDANIDACDQCVSCHKTDSGNHPDVTVIRPEGDGGQITVNSIRGLQESFSFKPFEGKWKVAIVDHAERMNQSAANAFLQTLEEPGPFSVIVLISSRPDMLLSTIRSRCQRISFSPLPTELMSMMVQQRLGGADSSMSAILSVLSGGRPGIAFSEDLMGQRGRSFDILSNMVSGNADDVWNSREEMEQWFDWIQLWMRDIAVYRVTGNPELLISRDMEEGIISISNKADVHDILKLARELYNIRKRLFFNLNKQITYNFACIMLKKMLRT